MECRDGWIFICCVEEHQWQQFVEIMGSPEWAEMELFENRLARGANFDALQALLQEWCSEQSVDELYDAAQAAARAVRAGLDDGRSARVAAPAGARFLRDASTTRSPGR